MLKSDHPTNDFLIVLFFTALCGFGGIAFYHRATDPAMANLIVTGIFGAFTAACGAKWGLTQAKPTPGSTIDVSSHTVTPPADPVTVAQSPTGIIENAGVIGLTENGPPFTGVPPRI